MRVREGVSVRVGPNPNVLPRATLSLSTRIDDSIRTTIDEKITMSSLKPPGPRES